MSTDPREPLGRLVHETRLAHEADRAAAEGRRRFMLLTWEERSDEQHELDMRIGQAVADYALAAPRMTDAECGRLWQALGERQHAIAAIREALDFAAIWTRTEDHGEIIAAARAGLKVLEGTEEEARDAG